MKLYRLLTLFVLVAAGLAGGATYAETPPWWNDDAGQNKSPGPAPVLEEYTLPNGSVETHGAAATPVSIPAPDAGEDSSRYLIQPGDVLLVSVWHEPDLTREVSVSPDGRVNYPLVGEVLVEGLTVETLRTTLETKLRRYINEAVVDVSVKEPLGNRVYVLGKVNRPGAYPFTKSIDVVQALSLAGGTAKFAQINDIKILRREAGEQQTYKFRYSDMERGRSLEQNIVLRSGDVVVVP
jgi:polysaccharide export outer membrane protein